MVSAEDATIQERQRSELPHEVRGLVLGRRYAGLRSIQKDILVGLMVIIHCLSRVVVLAIARKRKLEVPLTFAPWCEWQVVADATAPWSCLPLYCVQCTYWQGTLFFS